MYIKTNSDHEAYDTHLNYIKCISELLDGTTLSHSLTLNRALINDLDMKKNLISLTKKSLHDEYEIVQIDQNYSYASTTWLPVKSYYLIFNTLLTIEYIIKIQTSTFRLGHSACIEEFTRKLSVGEMEFSNPVLNEVFDHSILNYRAATGANLSSRTNQVDMYKMAIRKIARYKLIDWKVKNKIDLRKSIHKLKYSNYLQSFNVSIFDFAYLMRIRSNYRDFAFIDNVTTLETARYFNYFFKYTVSLVKALEGMKNSLISARR